MFGASVICCATSDHYRENRDWSQVRGIDPIDAGNGAQHAVERIVLHHQDNDVFDGIGHFRDSRAPFIQEAVAVATAFSCAACSTTAGITQPLVLQL